MSWIDQGPAPSDIYDPTFRRWYNPDYRLTVDSYTQPPDPSGSYVYADTGSTQSDIYGAPSTGAWVDKADVAFIGATQTTPPADAPPPPGAGSGTPAANWYTQVNVPLPPTDIYQPPQWAWMSIADISLGKEPGDAWTKTYDNVPAGGIALYWVTSGTESALGLNGDIYQDSAGDYYVTLNDGTVIKATGSGATGNFTRAQIQNEITSFNNVIAEKKAANQAETLKMAALIAGGLAYAFAPAISAAGSATTETTATTAATSSTIDTTALVNELASQQADQLALEQAIADANGSLSLGSVVDAADKAVSAANSLSDQAANVASTVADPAAQAAAQSAQSAASTLQTAAAAASTAPSAVTGAGLLSALKVAGSAAASIGTILTVAMRKTGVAARPGGYLPPGTNLTQAANAGIGTNLGPMISQMALPVAALVAVWALTKRK